MSEAAKKATPTHSVTHKHDHTKDAQNTKLLPVTVLSGFLGSGKTTLLKNILRNREGLRVALIVNDMAELNIDEYLIKGDDVKLNQKEEKMVAMQNGCICCTLREDLLVEIAKLAQEGRFDYLVIESTGISEPMPVAETFTFSAPASILGKAHRPLSDIAKLDTMVTVLDAHNFHKDLASVEMVADREGKDKMEDNDEDNRSIAHLLVDQVEFANVILLNKMDLVPESVAQEIEGLIRKLNPRAKIFRTQHSNVPLKEVINTGLFDMEAFQDVLLKEHGVLAEAPPARKPESLEYGISSFVYRRERPFHPERLNTMLGKQLPNVYRCKGIAWLAHRNDMVVDWNGVSEIIFLEPGGPWAADMDDEARTELPAHLLSRIRPNDPFGDRRQEIVIIGKDLDQVKVEAVLDHCLLTDEEMKEGPEAWAQWEDPFGIPLEDDEDESSSYNTDLGKGDVVPDIFSSKNLNECLEKVFDLDNRVNAAVAHRSSPVNPELQKWINSLLDKIQEKIKEAEEEDEEDDDEAPLLGEHVSYFEGDLSDKKLFNQFKKGLKTLISDAFSPVVGKKQSRTKAFLNGVQLLTDDILSLLLAYNNVFKEKIHQSEDAPEKLKKCSVFRVGIDVLNESVCPQYHYDHVHCRMLCAYQGEGTVLLNSKEVDYTPFNERNKTALEQEEVCQLGEDSAEVSAEKVAEFNKSVTKGSVNEIPTNAGDVVLLKGSRWPGNENFPLIHRSPAAKTEELGLRFLVRVDYITNATAQRQIAEDEAEAEDGMDVDEDEDEMAIDS